MYLNVQLTGFSTLVARRREKIYDVVILDPISGLQCDSNRSIEARGRARGSGNVYAESHVRAGMIVHNFFFFFFSIAAIF